MTESVSSDLDATTQQMHHWLTMGRTDRAIAAAQKADAGEALLELLEAECAPLGLRDQHQELVKILDDVPVDILQRSSVLTYWYGLALLSLARFSEGQSILARYTREYETSTDALIRGRCLVLQTLQQIFLGESEKALGFACQAIDFLPSDAHQELFRAWATRDVLTTHFGQATESEYLFDEVLRLRDLLPLDQHWWFDFVVPNRADLLLKTGRLVAAKSLLERQLEISSIEEEPILRIRLALIALEQQETEKAAALLQPIEGGAIPSAGNAYWTLELALVLAEVKLQSGQPGQAIDGLYEITRDRQSYGSPVEVARPNIVLADIWIQQGQTGLASHWLMTHASKLDPWPRTFGHPIPRLVKANLAIAESRWDDALGLLQALVDDGKSRGHDGILVQVYARMAFVYAEMGETELVRQAVTNASKCDKNNGFRQSYIVNRTDVRKLCSQPGSRASHLPAFSSEIVPVLRARELEVLHLMRDGLKNREIADRLYISLNTVKNHITNIFHRLGTNSRNETIEAAERLGLFDIPT